MGESTISAQLKHDYPGNDITLDAENQMLKVNSGKNVLLLSTSAIQGMDIFSSAGKHFYQVIVNLIYTRFDILPEEGSYADSLIIRKEDLRDFRIRKIAHLHKVGFLESGDDIFAVDVDDGKNFPLLMEETEPDPLDDEDLDISLQYYKYSFWREDDLSIEELEAADEDPE